MLREISHIVDFYVSSPIKYQAATGGGVCVCVKTWVERVSNFELKSDAHGYMWAVF